jgi:TatD DNase family protein
VAVGEIGLDFFWSEEFKTQQLDALAFQLDLAVQRNLPVSLHTRGATKTTIEVLKPFIKRGLSGVFHCFSGTHKEALEIIEMNFKIGVGGSITFKKNSVREFIGLLPLESIVLETDAPYLAPAPHRGKRNEPGYLIYIVDALAELFSTTSAEIAMATTQNAKAVFRIS